MKTKIESFIVFFILLCIGNANLCAQSSSEQLHKNKASALKTNIRKELMIQKTDMQLIAKYGFTPSQLRQYKAIRKESRSQIKQMKDSNLPKAEKALKIREIRNNDLQNIQNILNSEQWTVFSSERIKDCQRNKKVRGVIKNYKKELRELRKQSSDVPSRMLRNKLRGKCKRELLAYLDEKQANKTMRKINIVRISKSKEFKTLSLNKSEKKALASNKLKHQRQIRQLRIKNTPLSQIRNKRKPIDEIYLDQIKAQIGNERFVRWTKHHNGSFERRCREEFNFTEKQLSQFKDIKNTTALAKFKVNHSRLTNEQKKVKIDELRIQQNNEIKKILTQEQYRKLENFKNRTKQILNDKTIKI